MEDGRKEIDPRRLADVLRELRGLLAFIPVFDWMDVVQRELLSAALDELIGDLEKGVGFSRPALPVPSVN